MFRNTFVSVALCFILGSAWADIELSSSINDVYVKGTNELAGSISFRVTDNDFNGVSPESPVFIRLSLADGVRLAETRVDLTSEDAAVNRPIYLAMALLNTAEGLSLIAPADSLSIVRYVAGERHIWLRVQSNSNNWILVGDTPQPPGEDTPATFTIGVSARQSFMSLGGVNGSHRNLPFNTRDLEAQAADTGLAVSTLLCFDLTESELQTSGVESLIYFDSITFDQTAEVEPGVYQAGNDVGINFTADFTIGRAKDRACDTELNTELVALSLPAPPDALEDNPNDLGVAPLAAATVTFNLQAACQSGGLFLDTYLISGAYLTFATDGQNYGFDADSLRFIGEPTQGVLELDADSQFPVGNAGQTLYGSARLNWDGDFRALEQSSLLVEAVVYYPINQPPGALALDWSFVTVNHDGAADTLPFEGPDQHRRCAPSLFTAGQGQWSPAAETVSSRFRMIPHITRSDGGFGVKLIQANATSQAQTGFTLLFAENGAGPSWVYEQVPTGATLSRPLTSLNPIGPEPLPAFLIFADDSKLAMAAEYQASREGVGPAHLRETAEQARVWRIYPGNATVTWDGMALVNTGLAATDVTVRLVDYQGRVLAEELLISELPPLNKRLAVLSGLFGDQEAQAFYEIIATQPLAVTALRGNLASDYLWENRAVPVLP